MGPVVMCLLLAGGMVDVSAYTAFPPGELTLVTSITHERLHLQGKSVAMSKYYFAPWTQFFVQAHLEVDGKWVTDEFMCISSP